MWRPFACNIVSHGFDYFLKKSVRAETAPISTKKDLIEETNKRNKSVRAISEEAEKRILDFKNLKKKVRFQREQIKLADESLKRNYEMRMRIVKDSQNKIREQKRLEMIRIRKMTRSKSPTFKTSSSAQMPRRKKIETGSIFGLTAPIVEKVARRVKTPLPYIKLKIGDGGLKIEGNGVRERKNRTQDYFNKPKGENEKCKIASYRDPIYSKNNKNKSFNIRDNFRLASLNVKPS